MWSFAYLALGLCTGVLAGLLGIGGGLIMVSVLTMIFAAQGVSHEHLLHLALGTSMATIIFTAAASMRAHHARGAVNWPLVRDITIGVMFGALLGGKIASWVPTRPLALFFAGFILLMALQMAANFRPAGHRQLPGRLGRAAGGFVIGIMSALAAIGGGALTVPWLAWCNVKMPNAIGCSAALGFPVAVFGTLSYVFNGWGVAGLPLTSVGYVYLPALLCLAVGSMLTAPLGASLAHRMPVLLLKRIFAGLLVVMATKMLWLVWA